MAQQVRENVFLDRMISTLSAGFAVLATLLAAIGLYGVLAYTVSQRTREFGLRMALGADGAMVRGMVLRPGRADDGRRRRRRPGWPPSASAGWRQSLLFELQGYDPVVLVGERRAAGAVAFAAGLLPALRASRIAADGGAARRVRRRGRAASRGGVAAVAPTARE